MEGFYKLAKMVVNKKYPNEDDDLKAFFICAIYGLLCKYNNCPEIVCDVFLKVDLYMEKDTVSNILKKYNIDIEFEDDDDENNRTYAVSNQGYSFIYNEILDCIEGKKDNSFIVCSLKNITTVMLLNSFCHEMGHLIKGHYSGFDTFKEENISNCYMRTGLGHYIYAYNPKKDTLSERQMFAYFEEAINTIQTTEVMKEILDIVKYTDDPSIHEFVSTLDKKDMLEDHGYEGIVEVVRKLWEIDEVKKVIEENIVDGTIEESIYRINKMLNDIYGFVRICGIVDNIALNYWDEGKDDYINKQYNKFDNLINKIKSYQKTKK